jgi:hypothetical protein
LTTSAADLLRPITSGELRAWQGLPSDLSLADLKSAFTRDSDWSGSEQLGRRHREASYAWVDIPGLDGKLRVWCDGDRVILLDLPCSGLTIRSNELTELFAETPALLDTWQGTLPMAESELVFPKHGIAVFINRETDSIWQLALFPPATLETYEDDLRINMKTRRHQQLRR